MEIAFSRTSRNITVKYTHTPFHKTVGELCELFAPPPRPVAQTNQTPKSAKPNRKRDLPNDGKGGSSRKKPRTKKNGAASEAQTAGDAAQETPGAENLGGPAELVGDATLSKPSKKATPRRKKKAAEKPEDPAPAASQADDSEQASADDAPTAAVLAPLLNLDPAEAERRSQRAVELLQEAGLDPSTLSSDQFNIFANQSPGLQQESLAMLVRYGAERLRIIHPNKEAPAQDSGNAEPVISSEMQAATGEFSESQQSTERTPSTKKSKGPPLTRGSCSNCRPKKKTKVKAPC